MLTDETKATESFLIHIAAVHRVLAAAVLAKVWCCGELLLLVLCGGEAVAVAA